MCGKRNFLVSFSQGDTAAILRTGRSTVLHRIFKHFPFCLVNHQLIFQTLDFFCALAFGLYRCNHVLLFFELEGRKVIQGIIDREDAIVVDERQNVSEFFVMVLSHCASSCFFRILSADCSSADSGPRFL